MNKKSKISPQSGSERVPNKFHGDDPIVEPEQDASRPSSALRPKVKKGLYKPKKDPVPVKHISLSYIRKGLNSPVASDKSDLAPNIIKLKSQNSDRDESSTFGQSHKLEVRTLTIHDID